MLRIEAYFAKHQRPNRPRLPAQEIFDQLIANAMRARKRTHASVFHAELGPYLLFVKAAP